MPASQPSVVAILAHASAVPAATRAALAATFRAAQPPMSVLVETCHRTELYAPDVSPDLLGDLPAGTEVRRGNPVADHLVGLAVGLRSTVVAEDQILHQLRASLEAARARGRLSPDLDRLFDVALRAGRRARSWLPARRRPSLADVAVDIVAPGAALAGREVLVVGAGEMGYLAAMAVLGRGGRPVIASRTRIRAAALATRLGTADSALDPGPILAGRVAGTLVALRGAWNPSRETVEAAASAGSWIVDLSSPPALSPDVRSRFGRRLVTIDDLARIPGPEHEDRLLHRLERLATDAVREYRIWLDGESQRAAARAMAEQAERARATELDRLWERLPELDATERAEIERMASHLAERLLRNPLERLGRDSDGRHARAARELFGL